MLFAAAIVLTVCGIKGVFGGGLSKADHLRYVCDAFFAAGAVIGGFGLLVWCSGKGAFDGLKYGVSLFFQRHITTRRMEWHKKETFADYKERVHSDDKRKSYGNLLAVGVLFILISVFILIAYYKA